MHCNKENKLSNIVVIQNNAFPKFDCAFKSIYIWSLFEIVLKKIMSSCNRFDVCNFNINSIEKF